MRRKRTTRSLALSAFITGLALSTTPSAGAFTLPAPSAAWEQAVKDLEAAGIAVDPNTIDPQLIEDADKAVAGHNYNMERLIAEYTGNGAKSQPGDETLKKVGEEYRPILDGPNYHWRHDAFSKVMAQRPFADRVLHRVPGSWFDAPDTPLESVFVEREGNSLYGPSTPVYVDNNQLCTIAATGVDSQGRKVAITAGHCGKVGAPVMSADSWRVGKSGTVVAHGKDLDYSVIELGSNAKISRSYNGVTVNAVGGGKPGKWKRVCKTGVATGTTCGMVWDADDRASISQVCAMQGDSGAPLMEGDRLVGMVSGGVIPNYALACRNPWQGDAFMPTVSTNMDAVISDINAKGGVGAGFTLPTE
ncbi:hypothetical protein CMUST_04235 [Corynebacterium mustelae]|uniref:Trypsin n=1 Tax=Corynebacterium mustelae TaxID=571915 RepID=A0A0G3GXE6_9CORY|nr:S1 family peptidase [Corynebacterium mustelae]AKK05190.1 hypothetical protein CMUST_04235 [Corynebacterium mustelae]